MVRRHELDVTLVLLITLALATVWLPPALPSVLLRNAVVLLLAIVKGRAIALRYLDLWAVPALWRGLVTGWIVLLALTAGMAATLPHLL